MYTVEYSYYSYPRLSKSFETYQAAKGFFNRIRRASGVRVAELICPVTNEDIILDKSKPAYMVERNFEGKPKAVTLDKADLTFFKKHWKSST